MRQVWGWVNKIIDLDGEDNKGITQLEVIDAKPSPPLLIKQENREKNTFKIFIYLDLDNKLNI